jgi:hypothetical protein
MLRGFSSVCALEEEETPSRMSFFGVHSSGDILTSQDQ